MQCQKHIQKGEKIMLNVKLYLLALYGLLFKFTHNFKSNILTIDQTIEKMQEGNSIIRFGDGEFALLDDCNIQNYQESNQQLKIGLEEVIDSTDEGLLICLPDTINNLKAYKFNSKIIWLSKIGRNYKQYLKYFNREHLYGNAFVSRPYMIYKNKDKCDEWFKAILNLFYDKDIVLIEGIYSRSGVGNDLFKEARSVKRILCPNKNAFSKYDEILKEALKISQNKLILVALGPAGKVLAYELFKKGYMVWDIGHIDSEYEWYLRECTDKTIIPFKHTAESIDVNIGECTDENYINSIITII